MRITLLALVVWPFLAAESRAQGKPGDDFYAYANGAWLKRAVIPAGRDRWAGRDEINERVRLQILAVLDGAGNAPPGTLARKVADFRAALLNEAAIEQRGLAPLQPIFARIDSAGDRVALARLLGGTMQSDVDPLNFGVYASATVLGLSVEHSIHGEKTYGAFLVQGGLGLGDRDRYLSQDSVAVSRRARYRQYVAHVLALAGFDHADQRADSVLALETAIAQTQATAEASAVDRNADHQWSRADFAREAPGLDWDAFFDAAGLSHQLVVVAWQPSAVKGVAGVVASRSLDSWKDYLRVRLIDEYADVLPRAFATAALAMHEDLRPRTERALAVTQSALSGAVGQLYAERYFSPAQKARVRRIIDGVALAFRAHVANAKWLSPGSRSIGLAKLDALYVGIGYPEQWESWNDLVVDPTDAFGNARRVAERSYRRALARLDQPYDQHEWVMPPQAAGAVLIFQQNAYEFAAALLQPPKYDSTASDAAMYGAIGALIGHDVSHFVDVLGADYQPDGQMRRWWTTEDSAAFEAAAEPIVRQFSAYEPIAGLHVNGRLTRTENVADLAGLTAAFEAYRKSPRTRAEDRQFFIAFAQAFPAKLNEAAIRAQLGNDHAPEMYRMNTVRNLDAWYDAFDVVPGDRLYLAPADRVRIW
ncbi:MAG TPA: M13 family metallopeptidase [Gemmatimonadales bacterium]|nr:M13 family metallopeptidase [Gemmatimonadales bacterium]